MPKMRGIMFKNKCAFILLLILSFLTETALAQGIGGAVLPVRPSRFRSEIDAGFIYLEFAQFKFGDVRDLFPTLGGEVIKEVFNERPYAPSYYLGVREAVKLPGCFLGAPLELNARFGIYNAHHHSSFTENETGPEIYFPYIDGVIRI